MEKQLTAFITGATGFIGSNLARRLVSEGWTVHIVVRPNSKLTLIEDILNNIQIHHYDGSTECLAKIMKSANPKIVFHLASLFKAQHETKDVTPLIESNIAFGTQLLEAMALNGVEYLVNTGTSWQHYENKAYSPVCLYAATKQAFESILTFHTETTPIKAITLKLFDTYGPKDPRPKLFNLLKKTADGQQELAMSPGEQLIDLVYIDDVIDAYLDAADLLMNGKAKQSDYAITSKNPIKLKEIVEIYGDVIGKKLRIIWGARPYRPREVMVPWNKGKPLPNGSPKIKIKEGIKRMVDSYE